MDSRLYDPKKVLILGIAGHARSGKDTAAQIFKNFFNNSNDENTDKGQFYDLSENTSTNILRFADPIKRAAAEFMKYFFDVSVPSGLRLSVTPHYNIDDILKRLEEYKNSGELLHGIDLRKTQQQLGSVMRSQNENIFVEIMIERIKKSLGSNAYRDDNDNFADFFNAVSNYKKYVIIIPDTRFINEEKLMREAFGDCYKLVLVNRPEITEKAARREPPYDHESEQQIRLLTPDIVIKNDGDLDTFKIKSLNQIKKLLVFQGWLNG